MPKKLFVVACGINAAAAVVGGLGVRADEFTRDYIDRYRDEFMNVVKEGRKLWGSGAAWSSPPGKH